MKNLKGAKVLEASTQKIILGGRKQTDCYAHFQFCDDAHPSSLNSAGFDENFDGFDQCMQSCGC